MGKLPLDEVKDLDTDMIAEELELEKARELHKWECPACESSDALSINLEKGMGARCFSCDTQFTNIDLVMACKGFVFNDAVMWLAEKYRPRLALEVEDGSYHGRRRLPQRCSRGKRKGQKRDVKQESKKEARRREILSRFYESIDLGERGRAYLKGRAIPPRLAEKAGVRSVEVQSIWEKVARKFPDDELIELGLRTKNGCLNPWWRKPWVPFLVLPYTDGRGLQTLRFRRLRDHPTGVKYLSLTGGFNQPNKPFLSGAVDYATEKHVPLFVCEGEINALSIASLNLPCVGGQGSGSWQQAWCRGWEGLTKVVLLMDGDPPSQKAGESFGVKIIEHCAQEFSQAWVRDRIVPLQFKGTQDANEVLQEGKLREFLRPTLIDLGFPEIL